MNFKPALESPVPSPPDEDLRKFTLPFVQIHHPGYPDFYPPLLSFLPFDDGGIDYDIAYYACCILAGNVWQRDEDTTSTESQDEERKPKAYLATSAKPSATPITRPADGILRDKKYYFHVSTDSNKPYPIIPTFSHWEFPHGNLPRPWRSFPISPRGELTRISCNANVLTRDKSCRVTQSAIASKYAHIIPEAAETWFTLNRMSKYHGWSPPSIINVSRNTILLRADIKNMFDGNEAVMVPKWDGEEYKLVTHVLSLEDPRKQFELVNLYHNRLTQTMYGIPREYFFARFAWSIYNDTTVQIFGALPEPIRVRLRGPDTYRGAEYITIRTVRSAFSIPPLVWKEAKEDKPCKKRRRLSSDDGDRGRGRAPEPKGKEVDTSDDDDGLVGNVLYENNRRYYAYFSVEDERAVYPSEGESVSDSDTDEDPYPQRLQPSRLSRPSRRISL
ncbi:hypothetical protein K449DRAFT_465061 [Hypoxylon sp. EC38]|nr:hypothetical protein K449DRAFT_465061 [Hypoxylon sp. EC38]